MVRGECVSVGSHVMAQTRSMPMPRAFVDSRPTYILKFLLIPLFDIVRKRADSAVMPAYGQIPVPGSSNMRPVQVRLSLFAFKIYGTGSVYLEDSGDVSAIL